MAWVGEGEGMSVSGIALREDCTMYIHTTVNSYLISRP